MRQQTHAAGKFLERLECLFMLFPATVAIAFGFAGSLLICGLGLVYAGLFALLKRPERHAARHQRRLAQSVPAEFADQTVPAVIPIYSVDRSVRPTANFGAGRGVSSRHSPPNGVKRFKLPKFLGQKSCSTSRHLNPPANRPGGSARNWPRSRRF
jgi:hypothetical protein